MKNFSFLFLLLIILTGTFAQTSETKFSEMLKTKINQATEKDEILVWIYFTDKGTNTNLYYNEPRLVVSQKSIERREKVFGNTTPLTFRDLPVNRDYIAQVKSKGLRMKWPSKWLNAVSGKVKKSQLEEISLLSFVKKLDIVYKLRKGIEPNNDENDKIRLKQPEGINSYDYGASYAQVQQINVPAVHDSGYTGQGVTICVMDAGFNRLSHDVFLSMNIIAAWDFVNNDPNVGDEGDLGTGSHGTMTLSNIGGFAPGNLIGPAFNSSYILAKTENTDSETPIEEDNWIAAMEWADSIGVDVTSTSLSYLDYDPPYPSYTWEDMDGNTTVITNGADYAAYIGIVVVNSAGNYGFNASHNTLGAPADGDSVITAGAVNSSGSRSSFSSVGPTVDGRIKPDIMARGSGNVVASPSNDHNYTTASGTSFSCPLSAGVAALILCVNPSLTPMQVRDAMRNTASQSSSPDNLYGWGILNALDAINYFPPTPTTFQISVDIIDGWNMSSIPGLHPVDQNVNTWWAFRDMSANVFRFDAGYQAVNDVIPGEGYWMKHLGARTYNTGDEWPASGILFVPHNPIPIKAGWNIISVFENPVSAANLTTSPPGLISGPIYGYNGGYTIASTLYPGFSYWLKSTADGFLIIPEVLIKGNDEKIEYFKEDWGKIIFIDATGSSFTLYVVNGEITLDQYEMPPLPPNDAFDIRFSSNRIAEDINSSEQAIDMRNVTYPLTVRVENMDMRLIDKTGNKINENLKDGKEIVIRDAQISKLIVSGELLPTVYALEQNYPNPFNPNTIIKFSIPEEAQINLTIFDILGENIRELKNEVVKPGYHAVEFNATSLASGVYFYRIETRDFVQTKKMLLLK